MKTENRFSPSPAAWRNQAILRHPGRSTYRCFLTDLAGFIDVCRAGPDYAKRQDRKKTGLFHSSLSWNIFILLPQRRFVKKDICLLGDYISLWPRLESCCDLSEWRPPWPVDNHKDLNYGRRGLSELRRVRLAVR